MSLFKKYFSIVQEATDRGKLISLTKENIFCYLIDSKGKEIFTIYKKAKIQELNERSCTWNDSIQSFIKKLYRIKELPFSIQEDEVKVMFRDKTPKQKSEEKPKETSEEEGKLKIIKGNYKKVEGIEINNSDKVYNIFKKLNLTENQIESALKSFDKMSTPRSRTQNFRNFLEQKIEQKQEVTIPLTEYLEYFFIIGPSEEKLEQKKDIPFIVDEKDKDVLKQYLRESTKVKDFINVLFPKDPAPFIEGGYQLIGPLMYVKKYSRIISKDEEVKFEKTKNLDSKREIEYEEDESLEYNAIKIAKITLKELEQIVQDAYESEYNDDEDDKLYSKENIKDMSLKNFKEIFKDPAPFYEYKKI